MKESHGPAVARAAWSATSRRPCPGGYPENLPQNLALVALLKRWAERKRATPAQVALAWLMAQKPWIVPIPGTTQMAHLLENVGAADLRFTSSELAELDGALSAVQTRGARLPDQVLVFSGVEAPPKK
ncbi:MAG: aldo/keto reductase [Anaeromyxobacter sp.]